MEKAWLVISIATFLIAVYWSIKNSFYDALYFFGFSVIATFLFIMRSEMKRKSTLREWIKGHKIAAALMLLLSPVRANFVLLLDSNMFRKQTSVFCAPLPKKLRTKFRITSYVHLVAEDIAQLVLVLILTEELLGGWTMLNAISFAGTVLTILLHVLVTSCSLRGSYRTTKSRRSGAKGKAAADGEEGVEMPDLSRISSYPAAAI